MPVTLPLEVYEALERGLGKDDARKVVHGLEETISSVTEYKWATTKDEIVTEFRKEIDGLRKEIDGLRKEIDGLRKEFVTKELFEERLNSLRVELEGKIENVRVDLEGKIGLVKADVKRLDIKLNFMIILLIIALTLMNPVAAEIIKSLLKL